MLATRHAKAKTTARQREAQAQEPWRIESAKEMDIILNELDAIQAEKAASGENERAKESSGRLLLGQKEVIVRPHICQR